MTMRLILALLLALILALILALGLPVFAPHDHGAHTAGAPEFDS